MTKLTRPVMEKRLDELLKVVRYRNAETPEYNVCATCQRQFPIKELQCGHFIKRGNLVLKYDDMNLMPQCRRCNHFLDGAQDKAAYHIIQTYGLHNFQALIHTDYAWLDGKLKKPGREQIVRYYNHWLAINRETEKRWNIKLIPASWEPSEG